MLRSWGIVVHVPLAALAVASGLFAQPQVAGGASPRPVVTVRGTVRDSLHGGAPLAGAEVVLDGLDATALTDWKGRFAIPNVPIGRYRATFYHAAIDSLGFAGPVRLVDVGGAEDVDLAMHVPSAPSLYHAACGTSAPGHGVLAGTLVHTTTGGPLASAEVRVRWRRLVLGDGVRAEPMERTVRTDTHGRYRLCHVPQDAPMRFTIEAADGSAYAREITLGDAPFGVVPAIALEPRLGDRPTGVAVRVNDDNGRPMAGVQVWLDGARAGITDADGGALLGDLAAGAHLYEVRALGHRPVGGAVTARAGYRTPVTVRLGAPVVMLATRTVAAARDPSGFALRSASGSGGTYLDERQIAERRAGKLSDLFLGVPGVDVTPHGRSAVITMGRAVGSRGAFSARCYPVWYIDGVLFFDPTRFLQTNDSLGSQERDGLRPDMLDQVATPQELAGVEIYKSVASAPPAYATIGGECGVILVWTRRGLGAPR